MDMRKKRKLILMAAAGFLFVVLLAYVFLTPMGALRAAVFVNLYPFNAVTMDARFQRTADWEPAGTVIYEITSHIPHERPTDSDLVNWIVYRYGPFYTAEYYGWG
ncbi:MAG: hypothetical protein ACI4WY_08745 [Anaerovoracaceae bacterium]